MKLTDSKGKIYEWTTTTKAYALSGVAIGKCTIEEIEAPSGYVLGTKNKAVKLKMLKQFKLLLLRIQKIKLKLVNKMLLPEKSCQEQH